MILNLTLGANDWTIAYIHIGQVLYYVILLMCMRVSINHNYTLSAIVCLVISFFFKALGLLSGSIILANLGDVFSGLIFIIAGTIWFGSNLVVLYKYFLIFILISVPVMLIQKIGVHTFFYAWNVELFHPNDIYDYDEVRDFGKVFKDIPLLPTLFVDSDNLLVGMYQSRPTGLIYSNNILSSLICILMALHFSLSQANRTISYLVVSLAAVLSGSFMVLVVYLLLTIYLLLSTQYSIKKGVVSLVFLSISISLNYLLFPGLVEHILSESVFWIKLSSRFTQVLDLLGYDGSQVFYNLSNELTYLETTSDTETSESLVSYFFEIQYLVPLIVLFYVGFRVYRKKSTFIRTRLHDYNLNAYRVLLLTMLLCLIAVPVLKAPFFQITLGASLYPLLYKSSYYCRQLID